MAGVAELYRRSCVWALKRDDHSQWLELHEQHSVGECVVDVGLKGARAAMGGAVQVG